MKIRLVQVQDGRFGVQQSIGIFAEWDWCDINDDCVWFQSELRTQQYCLGTIEQANEALERHIMKNRKTKIRVVKVIRTVKV